MNHPALKGEVSINKMLKLTNPRLRRFNVVVNSFDSCIANTSKKFSRAPEMSFSEMPSKPRVFFEKLKGTVAFKQLKGFADAHSWGKLNKQVDMINSDVQLIDFAFPSISHLPQEELTIHPQAIELEGIFSIFNFPGKMESTLSEAMLPRFQIHFSSPETLIRNKVLTSSSFSSEGLVSSPSFFNNSQELNFMGHGDSSPSLKARVSSPLM